MSLRAKGFVVVSIPLGVMLLGAILSFGINREQDKASGSLHRSMLMRAELDKVRGLVASSETAVRGYLHTGNQDFLELFLTVKADLSGPRWEAVDLTIDHPNHRRRLAAVRSSVERTLASFSAIVEKAGNDAALPQADKDRLQAEAARTLQSFRDEVNAVDSEERAVQAKDTDELAQIEWQRSLIDLGGVLCGLLGGGVAVLLFSNGIVERVRHLRANADRLADGLPLNPGSQHSDEIGSLARALERAGGLLYKKSRALEESLAHGEQRRTEAEDANRAKSEFLSRMSHELRTPLNAILGFGQVLEMGRLDEQGTSCVDFILKAGRHLLGLIDEVLNLAKVEAGKVSIRSSVVLLGTVVDECVRLVEQLASSRGVSCTITVGGGFDQPVWLDEQLLRQVLLNLLSNAIKYNRDDGHVEVVCERLPENRLRVSVGDTGVGLTPEELARLFVPFERLGQEFGVVQGSGLGLVVSKRLIEALGGAMGAKSQRGTGSTFWFELPAPAVAAPEVVEPGAMCGAALSPEQSSAQAVLLHVEDNGSNAQLVEMALNRLRPGWRVETCADGSTGLRRAQQEKPDAILLDLHLPGLGGEEVLKTLRADATTRAIPVILVSADATLQSRERLIDLGADEYMAKPLQLMPLVNKLEELLTARRS